MILFEYACSNCGLFEEFSSHRVLTCPTCGKLSERIISTPRISLNVTSGDFPSSTNSWIKRREGKKMAERRDSSFDPNEGTIV